MRWQHGRRSQNVADRRGRGLGVGGLPMKLGGGTVLVLVVIALLGGNPLELLGVMGGDGPAEPRSPEEDALADFVSVVLADTEDTWHPMFERMGRRYQEPTLVLFTDAVQSACGTASSAVGPFYCPPDQQVYVDLSFFRELDRRFGAPGDFAQAYVVAHEVGHHVQTLLGTSQQVQAQRQRLPEAQANELSVRLELQADCFAGLWAHHADRARQVIEEGDVEEALRAAAAIGDDTLQRRAGGRVVPDSFTHGSAEQRSRWFRRGLEQGTIEACDTFQARVL
jgi:uncharacterized protein